MITIERRSDREETCRLKLNDSHRESQTAEAQLSNFDRHFSHRMHDTGLYRRFLKIAHDRFGCAIQAVNAGNKDFFHATRLELSHNLHVEHSPVLWRSQRYSTSR